MILCLANRETAQTNLVSIHHHTTYGIEVKKRMDKFLNRQEQQDVFTYDFMQRNI